nr:hypothetical protein [Methanobrevibacter smithii]
MTEDRFKTYDELEDDEKEVLDAFRQMKLMSDYNRFKLYSYKVEDLIKDYEQLKQLRENIQSKYFSVYDELLNEELIKVNWMQLSGESQGNRKMKHWTQN